MKSETKKTEEKENVSAQETALVSGELGEIKIHEDVVANLVAHAVLKTEGVSRLAGSTIVDAIADIVGSRRMQARAITVNMGEVSTVTIEIKLNLLRGFKLPDVAQAVQKNVIAEVEETTGMTVTKVNVAVQQIDDEIPEDEESPETANTVSTLPLP